MGGAFPAWACQGPSFSRKPSDFTGKLIPFYPGTNPFSPEWPPSGFLPRPHCLLAHYHFMVAQLSVCLPRSLSRRVSAPQGRNLTLFPAVSPCWEQCLAHSGCFSGQARPALLFSSLKNLSVPPSAAVSRPLSWHRPGPVLVSFLTPPQCHLLRHARMLCPPVQALLFLIHVLASTS